MQFKNKSLSQGLLMTACMLSMIACQKKEYALPTPKNVLQNDCIKRSVGPNLVGDTIMFAYAMALPAAKGKLASASVQASIAGAPNTYLDPNSYYTNTSGVDVGIQVTSPSTNHDNVTSATYTRDTNAATLRYYYVVPEEARGKTVSFTFSATSSDGETVNMKMGPYNVAKMAVARRLTVTDVSYISIADMKVYNATDAAANAAKIDLVYLYRNISTSAFNHALVAPAADTVYLPGVTLPAGVKNTVKIQKVFNLQDYQLAYLQYGIYIDDIDFQKLDVSTAPNYAINLKAEAGAWVETADGKYRAYIYFNSVNNGAKSAVISMKRYAL